MKFSSGGLNIQLAGKPGKLIEKLVEPKTLYLPTSSTRFSFTDVQVEQGQQVQAGDALATDPANWNLPLLAPRSGKVELNQVPDHITLEDISPVQESSPAGDQPSFAVTGKRDNTSATKLVTLGAWQFLYDAFTGQSPNPHETPQAVIVSIVNLEPYVARGDIQLSEYLTEFTRGLEHLQSFLEYQTIFLIIPARRSSFRAQVRERIRGYAWAQFVEIPMRYSCDHFNILGRKLKLKRNEAPVWALHTEGVLAIDRALTLEKPTLNRIISVGGNAVESPTHVRLTPGYPVKAIRDKFVRETAVRAINGGVLTGKTIGPEYLGIDIECKGLTFIPEIKEREFLGFMRPGWDRSSYGRSFLSTLRGRFSEHYNTTIRGEGRPCIGCSYCDEVCPARILPHVIHKYLYRDMIEEVDRAMVDLCIDCGLCSYVCPSKIDLREQFIAAKALLKQEREEARQAAELAREKEAAEQATVVEEKGL